MPPKPVLTLFLGDVVKLRRTHPCGGDTWLVDRLGADIGLRCRTCGRHVLLERRTLEHRLAGFESRGDPIMTAAVAGDAGASFEHAAAADPRLPAIDDRPASDDRPGTDDGPAA